MSCRTFFPRLSTSEKFEQNPNAGGPQPVGLREQTREPEPVVVNPNPHPLPKVIPQKITVTAPNGHKISRCAHGSYWTEKHGPAYCETCMPGTSLRMVGTLDSPMAKSFEMSKRYYESHEPQLHANAHYQNPALCPKCQCNMHHVESDGKWRCAECDHVWKGRKHVA